MLKRILLFLLVCLFLTSLGCREVGDSGTDNDDTTTIDNNEDTDNGEDTGSDAGPENGFLKENFLTWFEIPIGTGLDVDSDVDSDLDTDPYPDSDSPGPGCGDVSGPNEIWAGADDDVVFLFEGHIGHYNGSEVTYYYADLHSHSGIFALDQENVWVWGGRTDDDKPFVLRRDGESWSPEPVEKVEGNLISAYAIWGTSEDDLALFGQKVIWEQEPMNIVWEYDAGMWRASTRTIPSHEQTLYVREVLPTSPAIFNGGPADNGIWSVGTEVVDLGFPGEFASSLVGNSADDFLVTENLKVWHYQAGEWSTELQCPADSCQGGWQAALDQSGYVYLAGGFGGFDGGDNDSSWEVLRWDGTELGSLLAPCTNNECGTSDISVSTNRIWVTAKLGFEQCILLWTELPVNK
ncbi:MAG: hypothetical protein GY847_20670 [Proteobacteria bacterium]|nr:hypothetical protein [Pseudomonadota bacterium]